MATRLKAPVAETPEESAAPAVKCPVTDCGRLITLYAQAGNRVIAYCNCGGIRDGLPVLEGPATLAVSPDQASVATTESSEAEAAISTEKEE